MITINGLDGLSPVQPTLDISKPFIIENNNGDRFILIMVRVGLTDCRLIDATKANDIAVFNRMYNENMFDLVKNNAVEKFITETKGYKIIKSNIDITINVEIL